MNEKVHWNKIGSGYDEEIFDVFKSDRLKKLPGVFQKYANKTHDVIDFGCGIGKAFPYLAPAFNKVLGVDISEELLSIAGKQPFGNVTCRQLDLTGRFKLPKADFAFCCNVVMLSSMEKNEIIFRNIRKSLKKEGTAVLVLPSFDSFLYAAWRLIEWYRKEGVPAKKIDASELDGFKGSKLDIIQGLVQIDGVRTKHYSQSELEVVLHSAGFSIIALERLEYEWNTEFTSPPKWMKDPYPWDWLVECRPVSV